MTLLDEAIFILFYFIAANKGLSAGDVLDDALVDELLALGALEEVRGVPGQHDARAVLGLEVSVVLYAPHLHVQRLGRTSVAAQVQSDAGHVVGEQAVVTPKPLLLRETAGAESVPFGQNPVVHCFVLAHDWRKAVGSLVQDTAALFIVLRDLACVSLG